MLNYNLGTLHPTLNSFNRFQHESQIKPLQIITMHRLAAEITICEAIRKIKKRASQYENICRFRDRKAHINMYKQTKPQWRNNISLKLEAKMAEK